MKFNVVILGFFLLFSTQSCEKVCGPDLELGDHPLTELSKSYLPYNRNGKSSMVFKNQTGDSIVLTNNLSTATVKEVRTDSVLCKGAGKFDLKSPTVAKHNGERIKKEWRGKSPIYSEDIRYSVDLKSIITNVEQMVVTDAFFIELQTINLTFEDVRGFGLMRFSIFHAPSANRYTFASDCTFVNDKVFNGKLYKNVMGSSNDGFFMAQDKGLIAFNYRNALWVLDTIQ